MERIAAIFYDGKTSKAHTISIELVGSDRLLLFDRDGENKAFDSWEINNCKLGSFNSSSTFQLSHRSGDLFQQVEISDPPDTIIKAITKGQYKDRALFESILKGNAIKTIATSIAVLVLLVFAYIKWVSLYVGLAIVSIIPLSVEESIGKKSFNQYYNILNIDEEKSKVLQQFYSELDYSSEYDIEVYYAESDQVNAFALPGGKIVVFSELIRKTESWKELAALMAHEVAHINKRHTLRIMARQIGNYAVFSALTGDVAGVSSVIIETAITMNELVYNRSYEKEADLFGLQLMVDSEIDPAAMRLLFERLFDEHKELEGIMSHVELLSTHPLTTNRINYIETWLDSAQLNNYEGHNRARAKELWRELNSNE